MGTRMGRQPNGRYFLFSTVADGVTFVNCTRYDCLEAVEADAAFWARRVWERKLRALEGRGPLPPGWSPFAWEEALELTRRRIGAEEAEELRRLGETVPTEEEPSMRVRDGLVRMARDLNRRRLVCGCVETRHQLGAWRDWLVSMARAIDEDVVDGMPPV